LRSSSVQQLRLLSSRSDRLQKLWPSFSKVVAQGVSCAKPGHNILKVGLKLFVYIGVGIILGLELLQNNGREAVLSSQIFGDVTLL
jgi:hypothetical protein